MDIPFEEKPVTFESLRPPLVLSRRDALVCVACDAVSLSIASCIGLLTAGNRGYLGMLSFAGATALWGLFVFDALGLYRRSYSVFPRDAFYYFFVALGIASAPALAMAALIPQLRNFFPAIAVAFSIGLALTGGTRFVLFDRLATGSTAGSSSDVPTIKARMLAKRAIDVALSTIAMIVFIPPMLMAAASIYLESGRPIFFRQERVGLRGRMFHILKFRTMQRDAGNQWARPGDKRITRLGSALRRFSIDEIPQIFNVLQGDMSIVGPRPEMRSFAARFREYLPSYDERHNVKPGLTGWAQVYMKRNLTPADADAVLLHDLFYVRHLSIYLDLVLICKTAVEFLFHRAV